MRIGLLSLNVNTEDLNYGALLHTWAFQQVIDLYFGIKMYETINYIPINLEKFDYNNPIYTYLKRKMLRKTINTFLSLKDYKLRQKKFADFIIKQIKVSERQYKHNDLIRDNLPYDKIICESDVIWSPAFFGGKFDTTFFCDFVKSDYIKTYAYAASAANMDFTDENKIQFRTLLDNFNGISCRESYLANFIEEYCGKEATHVLDPVLLLEKEHYDRITEKRLVKKPYVVVYFPVQRDKRIIKIANEYAKEKGLEVIEISFFIRDRIHNRVIINAGIEEFISLIKYSECVFSNSFHATCLAILFEKEFYAFERRTGKKTEDLCRTLGILSRYVYSDGFEEKTPIDYSVIKEKMSGLKKNSLNWIERCLKD